MVIAPSDIRAVYAQRLHDGIVPEERGAVERGRTFPIAPIHARPILNQQLRHFRIAVQIDFGDVIARDSSGGDVGRTMLSLVCNDRPGLLADVAQVLRQQGLRVHDARIATFGERAEDVFQITDQRNQPLDETQQQALREVLRACLDGEKQ